MPHVVHILNSLDRGGAESVALDLCRYLRDTEITQQFVCIGGRSGALAPDFEAAGAIVSTIKVRGRVGVLRETYKILRAARPSAVQSHVALSSGWFNLVALLAGTPKRVARIHSEGDGQSASVPRRVYRSVSRICLWLASTDVIAVSEASLRFAKIPWRFNPIKVQDKGYVIPNGVNTDRFTVAPSTGSRAAKCIVLHVGRNSTAKRRAILPEISRALADRIPHELWVVGRGGISDLGNLDGTQVVALGERDDIPFLMQEASVLVLPSIREGLPGVVLEAMATGVPVVASDLPGLREVARELEGIILVPVESGAEEWAERIIETIDCDRQSRADRRNSLLLSSYSLAESARNWQTVWSAGERQ